MNYTDEELKEAVREQLGHVRVVIDVLFEDLLTADIVAKVTNFQKSYMAALIKPPNAFTREEAMELMKSQNLLQQLSSSINRD